MTRKHFIAAAQYIRTNAKSHDEFVRMCELVRAMNDNVRFDWERFKAAAEPNEKQYAMARTPN